MSVSKFLDSRWTIHSLRNRDWPFKSECALSDKKVFGWQSINKIKDGSMIVIDLLDKLRSCEMAVVSTGARPTECARFLVFDFLPLV